MSGNDPRDAEARYLDTEPAIGHVQAMTGCDPNRALIELAEHAKAGRIRTRDLGLPDFPEPRPIPAEHWADWETSRWMSWDHSIGEHRRIQWQYVGLLKFYPYPAPPGEPRGRPRRRGLQEQDEKIYPKMDEALSTKKVISIGKAAELFAHEAEGAGTFESKSKRLSRGFPKWKRARGE